MKYYVIGDLHNNVHWVNSWLFGKKYDGVIFLGDYFDSFGDDVFAAANTARWLAKSVDMPNRIHLMGNHDMPYRFPGNSYLDCPGWTAEKQSAVSKIMGKQWDKIKLAHFDKNYIFSHAGLTEKLFHCHPITGINLLEYEANINTCLEECSKYSEYRNPIVVQNYDSSYDGITWIRPEYLKLIPTVTQVIGHTPSQHPINFKEDGGECWIIDCSYSWIGVFEDYNFKCVYRDDPSIEWKNKTR